MYLSYEEKVAINMQSKHQEKKNPIYRLAHMMDAE